MTRRLLDWLGLVVFAFSAVAVTVTVARAQKDLPPPPTLEAAYIRERTELLAEKRALKAQLKQLTNTNAQREGNERARVDALTLALSDSRQNAEELEAKVTAAEEEEQVTLDRSDVIDSTIEIAAMDMRKLGYETSIEGDQRAVLEKAFGQGIAAVREKSTVHAREGSFFDASGTERKGTIVHVGRVAALGVADGAAGTLMPAPGGGMTLVDSSAAEIARSVVSGTNVEALPVHLFDPLAGPHEHRVKRTWVDVANAGGTIAWIIVALGGVVLLIVAERATTLALTSTQAGSLMRAVEKGLEGSDDAVIGMLGKRRGALARVLRAVLAQRGSARSRLEDQAAEAIYREMPRLERLLPFLAVIAGVAPMLGLLGTVTGMISTFEVITEHGTGDPKMLSGGISEALITTEFGLIVAIPALLLHNLLSRWSDRTIDTLQTHALSLINLLERHEGKSRRAEQAEAG